MYLQLAYRTATTDHKRSQFCLQLLPKRVDHPRRSVELLGRSVLGSWLTSFNSGNRSMGFFYQGLGLWGSQSLYFFVSCLIPLGFCNRLNWGEFRWVGNGKAVDHFPFPTFSLKSFIRIRTVENRKTINT
ncbi:uncharacterized protein PgNI_00098, partial [Pyricularia grisea]|uniref:Uncharacterized protein n=1 Tax=Pyricularia grisea TaxID=148305 RepID=A0A6P8BIP0_PYRGI